FHNFCGLFGTGAGRGAFWIETRATGESCLQRFLRTVTLACNGREHLPGLTRSFTSLLLIWQYPLNSVKRGAALGAGWRRCTRSAFYVSFRQAFDGQFRAGIDGFECFGISLEHSIWLFHDDGRKLFKEYNRAFYGVGRGDRIIYGFGNWRERPDVPYPTDTAV